MSTTEILKIHHPQHPIHGFSQMWRNAVEILRRMGQARGHGYLGCFQDRPHIWFFLPSSVQLTSHSSHILLSIDTLLFLCFQEKLNIDGIKDIIQVMECLAVKKVLIVYSNVITASAKKALEHMYAIEIELWKVSELQYDVREHAYYCIHEKLSKDEESDFLQQLSHANTQKKTGTNPTLCLPKILKCDPIVRFFGFQKNDILRIYRHDGTIVYRIVR